MNVERALYSAHGGSPYGPTNPLAPHLATVVLGLPFSNLVYLQPLSVENFAVGWGNYPFLTTSADEIAAEYVHLGGSSTTETFESEWSEVPPWGPGSLASGTWGPNPVNNSYFTTYAQASWAVEVFTGGNPWESFEAGWHNDGVFFTTILSCPHTPGHYSGDRDMLFEDFFLRLAGPVTYNSGSGVFAQFPHLLLVGYRVQFYSFQGSTLPTGLNPAGIYWVILESPGIFEISLTDGGAQYKPTDEGAGGLSYVTDPFEYWTEQLLAI